MIPPGDPPRDRDWTAARATDPVVQRYRAFFALLDWSQVPDRDPRRPWPGRRPHPPAAYLKALLVKLCEHHSYITQLRRFLVEHPLLILELGFHPVLDAGQPFGFAIDRTVPCDRWLRHQQQTLDQTLLQRLFGRTVQALAAEIPALGTTVAVDVKHIDAWVQENNPKVSVPHRFDPQRQPRGDPDCRLGAKCRSNQHGAPQKEYLWGYGTGIVSATDPSYGDVVLAELTQPFHRQDITYYHPLYRQAEAQLGQPPTNVAADAAFDAWHVYQTCVGHGGLAAIPLNARSPRPGRDAAGHPLCARGYAMAPTRVFRHQDGYRAQRYRCPLLVPQPTGAGCDHVRFAAGGCRKAVNLEAGGQLRLTLDRQGDPYRAVYRQRTSAERINSQATALGIERPKVRRAATVARLNTLTYLVINARALHRVRALNAAQAPPVLC